MNYYKSEVEVNMAKEIKICMTKCAFNARSGSTFQKMLCAF